MNLKEEHNKNQVIFQKKIYAIMGYPIDHSLSPYIHQKIFDAFYHPAIYIPISLQNINFKDFSLLASSLSLAGASITMPHKESLYPYFKIEDQDHLKVLKSINTIVFKKGGYYAFNTDYQAAQSILFKILNSIQEKKKPIKVILFGTGAMAKLFTYLLLSSSFSIKMISILGRREIPLKNIQDQFKHIKKADLISFYNTAVLNKDHQKRIFTNANLFINTSALGMNENDVFPFAKNFFEKQIHTLDLIYAHKTKELKRWTQEVNGSYENGLEFFIKQALCQAQIWNPKAKINADYWEDILLKDLKEKLKREIP